MPRRAPHVELSRRGHDTPVNIWRTAIGQPCPANTQGRFRQWQDGVVSSALPAVSRRRMLLGTAALAALGATAAACGKPPPPPDLDDLMAQLDMARSDSRLASDAATTANPAMRPALAAVSSERSILVVTLPHAPTRTLFPSTTSSPTPTTTSVQQATPPTAKDVV